MQRSTKETEIKLRFDSADLARERLETLGIRLVEPRKFEDNILYDRSHDSLLGSGRLLRLRRVGELALLTVKAPVAGEHRHKVREEHETAVEDAEATDRLLRVLGFVPTYRYQKYRTEYRVENLTVCLDETPVGCFVELEGPAAEIDRAAEQMGFSADQYELASYRELHVRECARRGETPGDMLLEQP